MISYNGITKSMYCYNCQEIQDDDIRTIEISNTSNEAVEQTAKIGNGYVKITLIELSQ